jgi:hypothetical protein
MGGINPNSVLAKELVHQDITSKSMPGLFRNDSKTGELDGLPLDELMGDGLFAEDDDDKPVISDDVAAEWPAKEAKGESSDESPRSMMESLGINENIGGQ